MIKEWSDEAWEEFLEQIKKDKNFLKRLEKILKDIEKICLDEKIPSVINEKMCKQCSYYEFCYI